MSIDISSAIMAIGGLGTASFALVDATKALGGGISNRGFGYIETMLKKLFVGPAGPVGAKAADDIASIQGTLQGNWINGSAPLADQKAIAKTLVKLRLDQGNAPMMAAATEVAPAVLTSIAQKYVNGGTLAPDEQNVAGRFDVQLSAVIDEFYQRADQSYRNSAKMLAVCFSVALAVAGKIAIDYQNLGHAGTQTVGWGIALLAGLLAAPLAPVSKDLASALQASVKTLQILRG